MAFLEVNPNYTGLLEGHGLVCPDRHLALPAVIVSGHPGRHVCRVEVGDIVVFQKREHRVRLRDRLASLCVGSGFVSRSVREARLLRAAAAAGVGCPEVVAAGEVEDGRAFVATRELAGYVELREFLGAGTLREPAARRGFFAALGKAIGDLHRAGFDHPDLYSKHVLFHPAAGRFVFLDWQRSRRRRRVPWRRRLRDLAALHASLADDLASPRDRLTCLRSYLGDAAMSVRVAARQVERRSARLRRRRRLREMLQAPLAPGRQSLVWLDGEALAVTHAFHRRLQGQTPAWLSAASRGEPVDVPPGWGTLLTRRAGRPLHSLWRRLRRKPVTTPEMDQAVRIHRLQRFGVLTPRLLACGQRQSGWWRVSSFVLTERPAEGVPLAQWLCQAGPRARERRQVLREAGRVLARIHGAGCHGAGRGLSFWVEDAAADGGRHVGLATVAGMSGGRRVTRRAALADVAALRAQLADAGLSRSDELRFLLAYLGQRRLTGAARQAVACLQRRRRPRVCRAGIAWRWRPGWRACLGRAAP